MEESDKRLYDPKLERIILATLLLNNTSVDLLISKGITSDSFYIELYSRIYNRLVKARESGKESIDIVYLGTLPEFKNDIPAITQLYDELGTASMIDHYAKRLRDLEIRRSLIRLSNDLREWVVEDGEDTEIILDKSEKRMVDFLKSKNNDFVKLTKDNVIGAVDEYYDSANIYTIGVPTGFIEIDRMTGGFRGGDLVIVAGRASIGKTSLAMNMGVNAAMLFEKNVLMYSLEMPVSQIAMRFACSETGVSSLTLMNKGISKNFEKEEKDRTWFQAASEVVDKLGFYVCDNPMLTVMDIKSSARNMKARCDIDLIIVDYLQLLTPVGKSDSRVQEIGAMTKALKILAKELDIPIILLSQLSRAVEHRASKIPQLSDLRESGCVTKDTEILMDNGQYKKVEDLINNWKKKNVKCVNMQTLKIETKPLINVFSTGIKKVFRLTLNSGKYVDISDNHPFYTQDGLCKLKDLKLTDCILTKNKTSSLGIIWDRVKSVEYLKIEEVYDLTVEDNHNFIANNILLKNSIEQDADLVMFVHRPEYYKTEGSSGLASVLIAKQRNGPTGTINLVFHKQVMTFYNILQVADDKVVV